MKTRRAQRCAPIKTKPNFNIPAWVLCVRWQYLIWGSGGAQSALDQTRSDINTATLVDTRAVRHCHCLVFPLCSWLRQCLCLAVTSFWTGLDSTVGPAVGGVDVLLRPRVAVFFSWALASRDAPGPFVRGTS